MTNMIIPFPTFIPILLFYFYGTCKWYTNIVVPSTDRHAGYLCKKNVPSFYLRCLGCRAPPRCLFPLKVTFLAVRLLCSLSEIKLCFHFGIILYVWQTLFSDFGFELIATNTLQGPTLLDSEPASFAQDDFHECGPPENSNMRGARIRNVIESDLRDSGQIKNTRRTQLTRLQSSPTRENHGHSTLKLTDLSDVHI